MASPLDGTTRLTEIRRKPKLWRKQDYAYHSENKERDREIGDDPEVCKTAKGVGYLIRPESALATLGGSVRRQHTRTSKQAGSSNKKDLQNKREIQAKYIFGE